MHPITLVIPTWAVPLFVLANSLFALATVIANVTSHLTEAQIAEVRTHSPRLASLLIWARHWGLVVWPGLVAMWRTLKPLVNIIPPAVVLLCILGGLSMSGCAASTDQVERRALSGTIASQGAITEGMIHANRDIYTLATNTLGARVQGADYTREVAPLDTVFDARSAALQALSADLYGAALLVNATRGDGGLAAYAPAAVALLDAIRRDIAVLRDGTVLPAVPIPAAVDAIVVTLQGIVGAVH